jgi:streptogramin lyase
MAARNGILWMVERSPARALLYAFDGKPLAVTDLRPWARSPFSVSLGARGEAYVTDPLGPAIVALSPAGSYTGVLSLSGTGVTRPTGVAVDPAGRVWVSDGVTGGLTGFDPAGAPVPVRSAGKVLRLHDPLRLGWARGSLWVLEGKTGRVRRIEWEGP